MDQSIIENELIARLPKHLKQFIKPQNYEAYNAIDQAVWRYVMRKNVQHLSQVAHHSYLKGIEQTGISIDYIPNMYGMNRILKEIGWAAVAVDGFIPPSAFMEFQAYNILVIASDIRKLDHIEYTPAPDIIHEAAGHAPIIANIEYAEYLRRFGEIGCKAISNAKDYELYEAVRELSILKEASNISNEEIENAEKKVEHLQQNMGVPSEMAQIRNLHWWTVEYGLIGSLNEPKLYGAGLLSSIGESIGCMKDHIKKIPYTVTAAKQAFDITKPQPQLYVTDDFAHLNSVLEEFANTMALRIGGIEGVQKLIESKNIGTVELSTGIQISGVFTRVITSKNKIVYLQTTGTSALAHQNKELIGHGITNHPHGFGTAIGKLKGSNLAIENMTPSDLRTYAIYEGERVRLAFEGGVVVEGEIITGTRNLQGKILLISFTNCTVTYGDEVLFMPDWGRYDMAVGVAVVSAYSGSADVNSFNMITHKITSTTIKKEVTTSQKKLINLYQQIRDFREHKMPIISLPLEEIFQAIKKEYPEDWLLALELYEIAETQKINDSKLTKSIYSYLKTLKKQYPKTANLINSGLELV